MKAHERTAIDEAIDLLVLNELPVQEQDDLIRHLDRIDGGWKRCAIAFIEDQRLGNAVRFAANKSVSRLQPTVAAQPTAIGEIPLLARGGEKDFVETTGVRNSLRTSTEVDGNAPRKIHWLRVMAATLILACGFFLGRMEFQNPGENELARSTVERSDDQTGSGSGVGLPGGETPSGNLNDEAIRQIAFTQDALQQEAFQIVAMLRTRSDDGDRFLPIVASSSLEEKLELFPLPRLSIDVTTRLKREGWQVDAYRQLVSMKLPDGKYSLTPLDLFNCRFVGKTTY